MRSAWGRKPGTMGGPNETDITEPYLERAPLLAPDSAPRCHVRPVTGIFAIAGAEEAIAPYRQAVSLNPNDGGRLPSIWAAIPSVSPGTL